jgi:regulatory protein
MSAPNEQNLYEAALRYLERYASSVENLRRVLRRRIKRWEIRTKEKASKDVEAWIESAVHKCVALGFVNDARYAEQMIASLRRQGRSKRYIQQALSLKGVPQAVLRAQLVDDAETEEEAARRYVQRRRLKRNDKDLAKLVRAGFALSVAKKVLKE